VKHSAWPKWDLANRFWSADGEGAEEVFR